jgi:hypothetical protein
MNSKDHFRGCLLYDLFHLTLFLFTKQGGKNYISNIQCSLYWICEKGYRLFNNLNIWSIPFVTNAQNIYFFFIANEYMDILK